MPLRGIQAFQDFYTANLWYKNFLPNHGTKVSHLQEIKNPFFKKLTEALFRNPVGNLLDHSFMKITGRRWLLKTQRKKLNTRGAVLSMDTDKHYAKPNPESFQNKLVAAYEKKIYTLFRSYDSKIQNFY